MANRGRGRQMRPGSRAQPRRPGKVSQLAEQISQLLYIDAPKGASGPPQRSPNITETEQCVTEEREIVGLAERGPGTPGGSFQRGPRVVEGPVTKWGTGATKLDAEAVAQPECDTRANEMRNVNRASIAEMLNNHFKERLAEPTPTLHRPIPPPKPQHTAPPPHLQTGSHPHHHTPPHLHQNAPPQPSPGLPVHRNHGADRDLQRIEADGATRRKLAIFYWETKTDISWIAPQLSVHHFDETIGLSITTDPNWRSEAKKASVIIFYHSKQSQKTEKDLQSFLCNCININEPQQNAEHSAKRSVGIFSRSAAGGRWGDTLRTLKSQINWMKEIRHTDISRIEELREEIAKCSYSILHFTKEHINDLKFLTQFEMKKVLVLIDDLEDCRPRTAGNQEIFYVNQEVFPRFPKEQPQNVIEPVRKPKFHGNVGIFSRSSAKDYEWLVTLLRSAAFSCLVKDVRPFVISNNRFLQFEEHISGCTTGILYHTKNRGGINITDVTSSLYDEELKTLASRLGKDNVFVLIDDLEDSGSGERRKILENQPSIVRFASDLLLITWKEKKDTNGLLQKLCFKYDKEETPALGMSRPTYVNVPEYLEVLP